MEVFTLAVAILSLIFAALALGWQVAAWAMDGPRVRATLQHGILGRGGVLVSNVKRNGELCDMSSMREQGWDGTDVVAVLVTNHGRARSKITRFGLQLRRGGIGVNYLQGNACSPDLPFWLEPGESATWYAELQDALALVQATRASRRGDAGGVFMTVETGTGKTVRTRHSLELQ